MHCEAIPIKTIPNTCKIKKGTSNGGSILMSRIHRAANEQSSLTTALRTTEKGILQLLSHVPTLVVIGKVETGFWGIIAVFLKPVLKNLIRLEKWHKIYKLGCNYRSILVNPTLKLHQGGGKPVHIKMTLFGLYLIRYQPHLSIFESF
jgi:hypothetical protein